MNNIADGFPGLTDEAMKTVISDDVLWGQFISSEDNRAQAEAWLISTVQDVDRQLAIRRADFEEWAGAGYRPDFHDELRRLKRWRFRALYFKDLCMQRRRQLIATMKQANVRSEALRKAIATLAHTVLLYERDVIDEDDLFDVLDRVTLPGKESPITLREYAEIHDRKLSGNRKAAS